ncbi:MAG: SWIM zinc finger family protein [Frankiaceae bacterium]
MLDGELPPGVADDAKAAGLDLLPGAGDVQPRCSCPDWSDPCKHSAAVCYLIAEQLDADPFGLLLLRGLGREDVLARVRGRRRAPCADSAPVETDADEGVMAKQVWEATVARPPLPRIPLPPQAAGAPVALPTRAPAGSGVREDASRLLADDAAERALDLALGGTGSCQLSTRDDLARWAHDSSGGPNSLASSPTRAFPVGYWPGTLSPGVPAGSRRSK